MSEDSRADRIRQRRNESSDRTGKGEPDKTNKPSKSDKPPKSDDVGTETSTQDSVKNQQTGTYMYLPEAQKRELDRLYSLLKAEYEYEFDQAFEKNRHFYPVVIQAGLDELEDTDVDEVDDHLDRIE